MPARTRELRIPVDERTGEVSGLLRMPRDPRALLVLAHGAGADMRHAFLESVAERLAGRGVATLRYQFPYTERGGRRPDPRPRLLATVRAAVDAGAKHAGGLPLFAGGKSMGGRMTSLAFAEAPLPGVRGIVFLGFPLHAPGRPPGDRAAHLASLRLPLLFVQGTRDRLAELPAMRRLVTGLGDTAELHVVEGGDHSFGVLVRSGRDPQAVLDEVADAVAHWMGPRT